MSAVKVDRSKGEVAPGLLDTHKYEDLIYDIGMHHGEDSEFYLKKGFRVVAIEGDPACVNFCKTKLARYLQQGQLTIVEGAIVDSDAISTEQNKVRFFKNESTSVWGTICPEWAQRNEAMGAPSDIIDVDAIDFVEVIQLYGVPHYMKIDIEGCDLICVRALRKFRERPCYISFESDKTKYSAIRNEINLLSELGYDSFQAVEQSELHSRQSPPNLAREGRYASHVFEPGCSGLFGAELGENWQSARTILKTYRAVFAGYRLLGDSGLVKRWPFFGRDRLTSAAHRLVSHFTHAAVPGWYDTHARLARGHGTSCGLLASAH